jgi:hypothetical protein
VPRIDSLASGFWFGHPTVDEHWEMRTYTARINKEYWLVVEKDAFANWRIRIWGPVPLQHDVMHASLEEAQAAAPGIARMHLDAIGFHEIPDKLVWTIAVTHW